MAVHNPYQITDPLYRQERYDLILGTVGIFLEDNNEHSGLSAWKYKFSYDY